VLFAKEKTLNLCLHSFPCPSYVYLFFLVNWYTPLCYAQDRLSQSELDGARDYDQILQEYMDDVGEDLCKNMQPPKSVRIAVKVKEDFGQCCAKFHIFPPPSCDFGSLSTLLLLFLLCVNVILGVFIDERRRAGELMTDAGVMNLHRNTTLFMRRDEVEPLIRQGVLEHMQTSVQ
jgi:hypothetical protein